MNIVFINLHKINLLLVPYEQIKSGWAVKTYKHKYFLDYLLAHNVQVYNFILCDEKDKEKEVEKAEYVYQYNGYEKGAITNIFEEDIHKIDEKDILIAYFHYFHGYRAAKMFNCKRVLMGNHCFRVKEGQYLGLKEDGFSAFVNEVDLSKNEFVNHFYNLTDVKMLTVPFIYADRFVKKTEFSKRANKAMAIGTCATVKGLEAYSGFISYYGSQWCQPMRREIYKKKRWIKKYIDSYISYLYEGMMPIWKTDCNLVKKIKQRYNETHQQQKSYTSFDIVEKFNEYKMFVCPEERVGIPGISTIEGMACGTAYIGMDHDMYRSIGLIPNVHYIAYDGTLKDMKAKICYYQSHEEELEKIAKAGMDYVREYFNAEKVASDFYQELVKLSEDE